MKKKAQSIGGAIAVILVVAFVVTIIVLLMGYDVVDASHLGVMNRFGVILGVMQSGMRWTGLMTHVEQYDLRERQMTVEMFDPLNSAVDRDGQMVFCRIQVNYRLNPDSVQDAYRKVGLDRDMAKILNIEGIIKENFKVITAHYSSTQMWQNRTLIKDQAITQIENKFPKEYFILDNVIISDLDYAQKFKDAIEAEKENEKLALAAQAAVSIAKFQADSAIETARGVGESNKIQKIAAAEADARALELKRLQITPLMVENNWIDKWSGQVPTFLIMSGSGEEQNTNLLLQLPSSVLQSTTK
jgi:regulator of protease activity HflC (stomatin/prohibitin superfamily)